MLSSHGAFSAKAQPSQEDTEATRTSSPADEVTDEMPSSPQRSPRTPFGVGCIPVGTEPVGLFLEPDLSSGVLIAFADQQGLDDCDWGEPSPGFPRSLPDELSFSQAAPVSGFSDALVTDAAVTDGVVIKDAVREHAATGGMPDSSPRRSRLVSLRVSTDGGVQRDLALSDCSPLGPNNFVSLVQVSSDSVLSDAVSFEVATALAASARDSITWTHDRCLEDGTLRASPFSHPDRLLTAVTQVGSFLSLDEGRTWQVSSPFGPPSWHSRCVSVPVAANSQAQPADKNAGTNVPEDVSQDAIVNETNPSG